MAARTSCHLLRNLDTPLLLSTNKGRWSSFILSPLWKCSALGWFTFNVPRIGFLGGGVERCHFCAFLRMQACGSKISKHPLVKCCYPPTVFLPSLWGLAGLLHKFRENITFGCSPLPIDLATQAAVAAVVQKCIKKKKTWILEDPFCSCLLWKELDPEMFS